MNFFFKLAHSIIHFVDYFAFTDHGPFYGNYVAFYEMAFRLHCIGSSEACCRLAQHRLTLHYYTDKIRSRWTV